jgi:hypothetical protein
MQGHASTLLAEATIALVTLGFKSRIVVWPWEHDPTCGAGGIFAYHQCLATLLLPSASVTFKRERT